MSDDLSTGLPDSLPSPRERLAASVGSSTLLALLEAMIQLAERNKAEHKLFGQDLRAVRDAVKENYNAFAGEMQKAFQQMRKEFHGEKRVSLALLNELLELGLDVEQIAAARPRIAEGMSAEEVLAVTRWADAVEVQSRKVQAALMRHGIHPYDAVVGSPYNPALHERVGTRRVEGMGPLLIAEQRQHGYASQQPEFVLRRPQVYVTE
jgi:molecular chaperone GrpE (heat shock protein)